MTQQPFGPQTLDEFPMIAVRVQKLTGSTNHPASHRSHPSRRIAQTLQVREARYLTEDQTPTQGEWNSIVRSVTKAIEKAYIAWLKNDPELANELAQAEGDTFDWRTEDLPEELGGPADLTPVKPNSFIMTPEQEPEVEFPQDLQQSPQRAPQDPTS